MRAKWEGQKGVRILATEAIVEDGKERRIGRRLGRELGPGGARSTPKVNCRADDPPHLNLNITPMTTGALMHPQPENR
jgi:hypothetical protein